MINEKLISIVLPTYNGEKYIVEMLDSVVNQNYRNIQLCINDDASTDNTYDICCKWVEKHRGDFCEIILKQNNKNEGLSKNISKILRWAKGKYIMLADQDDVWLSNKVEKQVEYMESHPDCMISLCDRSVVDANLNLKVKSQYEYIGDSIQKQIIRRFSFRKMGG